MSEPLKMKVIAGSVREGRFSDKAAAWIAGVAQQQSNVEVEILDLRDYHMPFFNAAETPSSKKSPYAHPEVARFTAKIAEGDAFIIVTPEYNHGTSGVLKNAMDWVFQEWGNKPVGFVSYGSVGGARAVEHLRLVSIELQMAPIRNAVHIPGADYFPVMFGQADAQHMLVSFEKKAEELVTQLLWWAKALKVARG
jgi:NAD(P)H-dependent FMN reductase